jgi:hypothetical protein
MARGWESKSVESQMESAQEGKASASRQLSSEDKEAEREKQNLLLSRIYVQHQIESANNQRYAESLHKALDELERKLAHLDGKG